MWTRALCFEMASLTERMACSCYQAMETLDKVDIPHAQGQGQSFGFLSQPGTPPMKWFDVFVTHVKRAFYALRDIADAGVLPKDWLKEVRNSLQTAVDQRGRSNYNPLNGSDVRSVKNALFDVIHRAQTLQALIKDQQCKSLDR